MGKTFNHQTSLDHMLGKAKEVIENGADSADPFFLYFALTAPHKPALPAERFETNTQLGPYGDFITQVDWTVGEIMKSLQKAGVDEDTLLIVSSDNCSYMYELSEDKTDHSEDPTVQGYRTVSHRANSIYRGTKADIWEGGHRVPFFARWPKHIKPGTQCSDTICLTDFMATCADVVGHDIPAGAAEDSFSFYRQMHGEKADKKRPPVIHHSVNGTFAIRDGDWKLVLSNGSGGREKPKGKPFEKPYQLFNLRKDPSETNNVIKEYPGLAKKLEDKVKEIRS
jgi:arylsulfatase A-like enzyme